MIEERVAEGAKGQLTAGIAKQDNLVLRAVEFIYNKLSEWRDDPNRPQEESEPKLNPLLAKFLNSRARVGFTMVQFTHEEPQTGRSRGDLSVSPTEAVMIFARVFTVYDPFLVIECKRLPAPSKKREREYLTGGDNRTGGVQRFKLGLYAPKEENAVLIGYIQSNDSKYWHEMILSWMKELAGANRQSDGTDWGNDECLEPLYSASNRSARWLSRHSRTGSVSVSDISIHHLWIEMTSP